MLILSSSKVRGQCSDIDVESCPRQSTREHIAFNIYNLYKPIIRKRKKKKKR